MLPSALKITPYGVTTNTVLAFFHLTQERSGDKKSIAVGLLCREHRKRESGANPELPRSGEQERPPSPSTVPENRDGKRRPVGIEALGLTPASPKTCRRSVVETVWIRLLSRESCARHVSRIGGDVLSIRQASISAPAILSMTEAHDLRPKVVEVCAWEQNGCGVQGV